jgi:hypothetical protein
MLKLMLSVLVCPKGIPLDTMLTCQSDFGATHSTVPSALNGMDMELPGEYYCELAHAEQKH